MRTPRDHYEILIGEGMKSAAETTLQALGESALGGKLLEHYAFGSEGRITDPRLEVDINGVVFKNPVIVGAGWDKQGRALHGLYHLGFGGVEVGTVPPRGQLGQEKPRLWTINPDHSVAINRLGFNSPGMETVEENLEKASPLPFNIGINVGRNKTTPNEKAHEDHEAVIRRLGRFAGYVTLGISSPNTPDHKKLQEKELLREQILSAMGAMPVPVPLFVKIDAERNEAELNGMIEVAIDTGAAGFVAVNSITRSDIKAKYGKRWEKQEGGLSGADKVYRDLATLTVRRIYEEAGDLLTIIAAGGVDSASAAMDKIVSGASAVQVVTAIRPSWGRVAANINRGLLARIQEDEFSSIKNYVGLYTDRGPLHQDVLSGSLQN